MLKLWCATDSDNGTLITLNNGKCSQGYEWVQLRQQGNLMYYMSVARMQANKAYIGYVVE
jgi:L-amino acid N-acyltransferase YncA